MLRKWKLQARKLLKRFESAEASVFNRPDCSMVQSISLIRMSAERQLHTMRHLSYLVHSQFYNCWILEWSLYWLWAVNSNLWCIKQQGNNIWQMAMSHSMCSDERQEFSLKHPVFIRTLPELPMAHAFVPVSSFACIWLLLHKKQFFFLKS